MTIKKLWAPWRIKYIKNFKKEKGCLFCRVSRANGTKADAKNLVIARTDHSFSMLNLYPYNNGHLMVAPMRHIKSLEMLQPHEISDLMELVNQMKALLEKTLQPQGYNIGWNIARIAGAGFDEHLHVHIVPRWAGDANFMTPIADTRIVSQSISILYKELKMHLKSLKRKCKKGE